MTVNQLRELLDDVEDTRELIISSESSDGSDELLTVWSAAETEASDAYELWRRQHTSESYSIYRAAADRADAAQDILAQRAVCKFGFA